MYGLGAYREYKISFSFWEYPKYGELGVQKMAKISVWQKFVVLC